MPTETSAVFDIEKTITTAKRFITGKLLQSGLKGYVIGLSGGIDSALSATFAVQAIGSDKVFGVLMPYRSSSPQSAQDAMLVVNQLGIQHRVVEISPMIDAYFSSINDSNRLRAGNKMARERMSVLFDIASERDSMVLGTGNRTEICLGYTTWYGDSACSINPIGELYKSEVRLLSKHLGVPEPIITKAPTADLWPGQTDEGELGVTYENIDRLLRRIVDDGETSMNKLTSEGFSPTDVSRVVSLHNRNDYKRRMADIVPLGKPPIPERIQLAV
jgi:NAD+ synthase